MGGGKGTGKGKRMGKRKGKGKGKRLCEFRVLGPELGKGAEGASEALAHAGRDVRVERPANDEVHEVGEVRSEEGRVRGAEGREEVDCRGHLLVVLAALEQRGEARGEARKEGRQRVGGAEVEHLRDDAEDAREAEGVVRLGREGARGSVRMSARSPMSAKCGARDAACPVTTEFGTGRTACRSTDVSRKSSSGAASLLRPSG